MASSTINTNGNEQRHCRLTCDFDLLRHSSLFSGLHLDVVKLFAYLSVHRSFRTGEYLVEQGNTASAAFFIVQGRIEITVTRHDKEVLLQPIEQGTLFGELALLASFHWFFNARAAENVDVMVIDRTTFQKVLETYPDQKDRLIERIVQLRINRLVEQTDFILDTYLDTDRQTSAIPM